MAYEGSVQPVTANADHGIKVAGQSIYEASETAKCSIGTLLKLGDRQFKYCKNGAVALGAAYVVQAPVPEGTYSAGQAIGTHGVGTQVIAWTVNASGAAFTKDQFKDGYFLVDDAGTDATEEGYMYKIKSNTAAAAGAISYLTLYDRLAKGITATATGKIIKNPCNGVVIDAGTSHLVGVPLIEVPIGYYFWAQFRGLAPVVDDGTGVAIGTVCTSTSGETDVRDAATEPILGKVAMTGAANDVTIVDLML